MSPEELAPEPQVEEQLTERLTTFETVLVAAGAAVFLFLLWEMQELGFLTPLLLALTGSLLLWPLRAYRAVQAILVSGGFLVLLWLVYKIAGVLVPFIVVYVLAYICDPAVQYLQRRFRVPRWVSSLVVTLLLVGLLVLLFVLVVPQIVSQVQVLAERLLLFATELPQTLANSPFLARLEEMGVVDRDELNSDVASMLPNVADVTSQVPMIIRRVFRSVSSILAMIVVLAVVPVVLFYTLKDYPFIQRRLVEVFPTFQGRRDYLLKVGSIVGDYMRGVLVISAISAVNVSFWLIVFDFPFALLIGILAGFLNLIPNIGAVVTNLIASAIALIFGDPWVTDLIIVQAVFLGQQFLETAVLTPSIMSHSVGLHPVVVILSLFVFGEFFGLLGLLIAVPATALLMTMYKTYRNEMTFDLTSYTRPPGIERIFKQILRRDRKS